MACLMFCGNSLSIVSGRKQTKAATISAGAPRTIMGRGFLSDDEESWIAVATIHLEFVIIIGENCNLCRSRRGVTSHNWIECISSQKRERLAMKGLSMPKSRATVEDVPIDWLQWSGILIYLIQTSPLTVTLVTVTPRLQ